MPFSLCWKGWEYTTTKCLGQKKNCRRKRKKINEIKFRTFLCYYACYHHYLGDVIKERKLNSKSFFTRPERKLHERLTRDFCLLLMIFHSHRICDSFVSCSVLSYCFLEVMMFNVNLHRHANYFHSDIGTFFYAKTFWPRGNFFGEKQLNWD